MTISRATDNGAVRARVIATSENVYASNRDRRFYFTGKISWETGDGTNPVSAAKQNTPRQTRSADKRKKFEFQCACEHSINLTFMVKPPGASSLYRRMYHVLLRG